MVKNDWIFDWFWHFWLNSTIFDWIQPFLIEFHHFWLNNWLKDNYFWSFDQKIIKKATIYWKKIKKTIDFNQIYIEIISKLWSSTWIRCWNQKRIIIVIQIWNPNSNWWRWINSGGLIALAYSPNIKQHPLTWNQHHTLEKHQKVINFKSEIEVGLLQSTQLLILKLVLLKFLIRTQPTLLTYS